MARFVFYMDLYKLHLQIDSFSCIDSGVCSYISSSRSMFSPGVGYKLKYIPNVLSLFICFILFFKVVGLYQILELRFLFSSLFTKFVVICTTSFRLWKGRTY